MRCSEANAVSLVQEELFEVTDRWMSPGLPSCNSICDIIYQEETIVKTQVSLRALIMG